MHLLSQIIYSCKTFYMFRTVFPSIIRSSKLRVQQRYMSNSCCYLLLSGMRCSLYYSFWYYTRMSLPAGLVVLARPKTMLRSSGNWRNSRKNHEFSESFSGFL